MIIWLASYPKSGNTLLRSILSSYFYSKDGDFSKPFKSELGWHIVKRIKKYEVPELEKMEAEITAKIRRFS